MKKNLSHYLKNDLLAGVVVFLVALPLCLGVALASGAPLFSGIIAGIVGGIVVGLISGSSLGVSGPAAGLTVIVLGAIQGLKQYEAFLLAVVLAGVFQVLLSILKAGAIANYFGHQGYVGRDWYHHHSQAVSARFWDRQRLRRRHGF
jgi:MFS superfamily sulfate permease-like transporter